jgi:hypothetical protein
MVVYQDHKRTVSTREFLRDIEQLVDRMIAPGPGAHDDAVELLITFGEFESALSDVYCREHDRRNAEPAILRKAGGAAGHLFAASWETKSDEAREWAVRLHTQLDEISRIELPSHLCISVPEGYAYYSLYPEMYYASARRFVSSCTPQKVVCIGLRSIGTSLSAVVAAAIERSGCPADSCTVRPRGHAFNRFLLLAPEFEEYLRARSDAYFLIVDEGPGLSGSSFCATAQKLSDLGIADHRIVFIPSWTPAGNAFVNTAARERWPRHAKFCASFEEVWIESGRLTCLPARSRLIDISAGAWRKIFFRNESDSPAVYANLERRKYLCMPEEITGSGVPSPDKMRQALQTGSEIIMLKFAGLGKYGRRARDRAERIARAGFSPPVFGLSHGFLACKFMIGTPLAVGDAGDDLVSRIAAYVTFLRDNFPEQQTRSFEDMVEMICTNAGEGLGKRWVDRFKQVITEHSLQYKSDPVGVDGHMLPHEWIRSADGYYKTDETDHHADHYFPGCQDIAWDIAGAIVEFGLGLEMKRRLIERYSACAHDAHIRGRLPFYATAYCAYRLGFATLAADVLAGTPDGEKFRRLSRRYALSLQEAIAADEG